MDGEYLDLDSPAFDSQKYVKHYLKTHSVQDLIKHHNQLQGEIKDYDQNIQTLVFENYSKFISSIDTVKKMKTDIQKVESKMSKLTNSMDKIASLSRKIDSALSVKRGEIIKLDTVNRDLSRLNNVCNLPHVIQKDLDAYYRMISARGQNLRKQPVNFDEYFNETSQNYSQCYQMLEKYLNLIKKAIRYKAEPLIQPIHRETTQKLEQVRQVLWNALLEFKQQNPLLQLYQNPEASQISTDEARSAVKKLMLLMDDEEGLIKHYQKMIKERYLAITKELIEKVSMPRLTNESSQNLIQNDLWRFLEEKNFEYNIDDLEEFKQKREKELNDSAVQGSLLWLINQLCNVVFRQLRIEAYFQLVSLNQNLKNPQNEILAEMNIKEIIYGVFSGLAQKMSQHKLNNFQVNEVFKKLQSELQSLFSHSQLKMKLKQEISDKFSENVENICRGQVLGSFAALRTQFLTSYLYNINNNLNKFDQQIQNRINDSEYMDLEGEVKREAYNQVSFLKNKLTAGILLCLLDLRGFVNVQQQSYIKDPTTYVNLIQGALIDFCRYIPQILGVRFFSQDILTQMSLLDKPGTRQQQILIPTQCGSLYTVFINCFLQLYNKSLMHTLLNQMNEVFPNSGARLPTENELGKLDKAIQNSTKDNLTSFSLKCCTLLIDAYQINKINFNDSVSLSASQFVSSLKIILLYIQILFPDQKRGIIKKPPIKRDAEVGFNIQMERVMVRKCRSIEIVNETNSRTNVLNSIIKYFLKVILQRSRKTLIFSPEQNKQLQIDLHFILQIIYELVSVDDEGLINGFYLELLEDIQSRCVEDIKLPQKQLEQYSSNARQQIKI